MAESSPYLIKDMNQQIEGAQWTSRINLKVYTKTCIQTIIRNFEGERATGWYNQSAERKTLTTKNPISSKTVL